MDNLLQVELRRAGYEGELDLSSLIEACGEEFSELDRNDKQSWVALSDKQGKATTGYTPEEAVARLWLALHPVKEV